MGTTQLYTIVDTSTCQQEHTVLYSVVVDSDGRYLAKGCVLCCWFCLHISLDNCFFKVIPYIKNEEAAQAELVKIPQSFNKEDTACLFFF